MADECFENLTTGQSEGDLRAWHDVPIDDLSPFIHRFRTPQQTYVYDVNTRRIMRVSEIVWNILEDHGHSDDRQIIDKRSATHGREQVTAALEEIESARRQGLLLSFHPRKVESCSEQQVRQQLADHREQLILNVTDDCNFRCSYCVFSGQHRHFRTHSAKEMSWEVARRALDEFLPHSRLAEDRVISFYGGEPLLNHSLICKCVAYVRNCYADQKVRFALTINGSLLAGDVAKFLAEEGFQIIVSLDGPAEIHDRYRRTKSGAGTWDRIISNVRDFLAAYPESRSNGRLRFNAVATRTMDLCEAERFWGSSDIFTESMGLEIVDQKQPDNKPPTACSEDPLATSAQVLHKEFVHSHKTGRFGEEHSCRSRWVQTAVFQKPLLTFHKRGYLSPHLPEKMAFLNTCIPGARRTFVTTDGDYFACERVVQSPAQIIGNVADGISVEKVVELLDRWSRASEDQCRYCWCISICRAGCLATVSEDGSITKEAKAHLCAKHRKDAHQTLVDYCKILEENAGAFDYMVEFEMK